MNKELEQIVQRMIAAGESHESIQSVIAEYNQKKNSLPPSKDISTDVLEKPAPAISQSQPKSKDLAVSPTGELTGTSIFDNPNLDMLNIAQNQPQLLPQPEAIPEKNFTPDISNNFGLQNHTELAQQNESLKENTFIPSLPVLKRKNVLNQDNGEIADGQDEGIKIAKEYSDSKKLLDNQKNIISSQILNAHQDIAVSKGDMQAPKLFTPLPIDNKDNPVISELHSSANIIDENAKKLKQETFKKAGAYVSKITNDATVAGLTTRAILGDKNAIQQSSLLEKGYPVSPTDMFYNDKQGLNALHAGLDEQYKDNLDNPEYISKKQNVATQEVNLINKYPEFKNQQISKIIAQQIMKDHPNIDGMAVLPAAKDAITKLGLTAEDVKNIDFDNLPIQSPLSSAAGAIYNGIISLGAGSARILGSAVGVNKDYLTANLSEATKNAQQRFADVSGTQSAPTIVDADKASPTYLQDIVNPEAGKYNYNFHTVSNAIGHGIGALAQFVGGTKVIGGIAQEIIPAVDATEAGMAGLMVGQGYEPYYQKAREVISDKPEDEWKRHAYALINGSLDYYAFKGLGKVVKGISPEASQEAASIFKDAPSLSQVNKEALTSWATKIVDGVKQTAGETAFVGSAQAGSELAKNIVDNVVGTGDAANKSNKDLGNVLLAGVESLPFAIMIPVGLSKVIAGARGSYVYKENIYNSGLNPETYLGQANKLLDDGVITQDQFNQRAQVINTATKVVNSIPTDIELNHNQRVAYTNSKVRELALKSQLGNVEDAALEKFYNDQITSEVKNRTEILNGGSKDNEFLSQISDTNQKPEVTTTGADNTIVDKTAPLVSEKYISEIKGTLNKSFFANAKDEQSLNDALDYVSGQWHDKGTRSQIERDFPKEIVDLAKEKFPQQSQESLSVPKQDASIEEQKRKDNADLMRDILDETSISKDANQLNFQEKDNIHVGINDYEQGKISGGKLKKVFTDNGVPEEYLSRKMVENGAAQNLELQTPPQDASIPIDEKFGDKTIETDKAVMQGSYGDEVTINDEQVKLPKAGFLVSDVNLKEGVEKGKGRGQEIYKQALDKYGTLYSSHPISEDALRAQDALEKKGLVTIKNQEIGGNDFRVIEKVGDKNVSGSVVDRTPEEIKNISREKIDIENIDMQVKIPNVESFKGGAKELPLKEVTAFDARNELRKRLKALDNIIKCL